MSRDTQTSEQVKIISAKRITMEVSPYEMAFIFELRKHSFGRVTAVITDGVPLRLELNQSVMVTDTDGYDEVVKSFEKELKNDKPKWSPVK